MSHRDARIDAYIAHAADFAQPILKHVRELVHRACPEVEETMKWSMPAFVHKGLLCVMAAFKEHATLNFWKGDLVLTGRARKGAMGQFGRLTSIKDLPAEKTLLEYIRKAAALNEVGQKSSSRGHTSDRKHEIAVPPFLVTALEQHPKAKTNFEKFSYSHKKEYIEWLTGAKREETRQRRLESALAWITDGKPQNWKYLRC